MIRPYGRHRRDYALLNGLGHETLPSTIRATWNEYRPYLRRENTVPSITEV